jgi:hypothetical protein
MNIAAHRANPGISIDQHVKRRVVALGRSLDDRAAIYLDTKFWIMLRECAEGKGTDASVLELLHRLRTLVAEGKVFCPVSESHLFEFLKQDDMNSRLETARIVDELSLVIFLEEAQRDCVPHHAVLIAPGLWLASPKNGNISNVGRRLSAISLPSCSNWEYRDSKRIQKSPQLAATCWIYRPTIFS